MAEDALAASFMKPSTALVEMTDPVSLARLSTETGSAPLSTRLLLKFPKAASRMVRRSDGTINRRLADLLEYKVPADEVPKRGVSSKDVVIDTQTGLWVRVFLPQAQAAQLGTTNAGNRSVNSDKGKGGKTHVIFYFHGGGFAMMSADAFIYDTFCRRLCRQSKAVVISVNYRRAPEHRYPVAYDDSHAAVRWLEGFNGDLFKPHELDLSQCVLMGDSAGGNIVHHIGCRWAAAAASNASPGPSQQLKIAAHVLLFPFFGGEERTPSELRLDAGKDPLVRVEEVNWHWRAFLPPNSNRDHAASNVFGPNAPDISPLPLPPSLVVIAEFDMLKDWQLRYAQGLTRAAKPVRLLYYVGGVHCFHILTNGKLASDILSDIMSFIKQNLAAGGEV